MKSDSRDFTRITSTPRARRRATIAGIELGQIKGTGLGGRILDADVERAITQPSISAMRRTIAQRTTESFRTMPHFYLETEIDATGLVEFRRKHLETNNPSVEGRLSFTDLILRAQAIALDSFPEGNALWKRESIQRLGTNAVGLVVSVPSGLYVPIILDPHLLKLDELAFKRFRLVYQARMGQLDAKLCVEGPGAHQCATSLSNLGSGRVDNFLPVIHVGQSSMLAVGRLSNRPWVAGEALTVKPTLKLTLAVDHRVMDGASAAVFLEKICEYLESPREKPEPDQQ